MTRRRPGGRSITTVAAIILLAATSAAPRGLAAQPRVVVETTEDIVLSTVSPRFTIRSFGFGSARPLRVTMRVSEDFGVLPPFLVDTTFLTNDTAHVLQIRRALPSSATVYWRALVESGAVAAISDITGPRVVPPWVELISPQTETVDTRQPLFRWRSPRVDTPPGPWRYELEIRLTTNDEPVFGAANIADTVYRLPSPLQASTSYRWRVTASLVGAPERVTVESLGTFVILDQSLPTSTLVYQNFPNPFPSATSFSTCFWFDVGEPGARISLEILDLRGNPVNTVVPAADGQVLFPPGRYGRAAPGTGSSCDNRFIWNGTARDGRTVPPGVYLARFRANGGAPIVRRILFRGR